MCEPPVAPLPLSLTAGREFKSAMKTRCRLERHDSISFEGSPNGEEVEHVEKSAVEPKDRLCRSQLQQDVDQLEELLRQEMKVRLILENATDHATIALHDSSYLPNDAHELLSNIVMLEDAISRLEEELVTLHYQLIQERNERRLIEYQLKQHPAQPLRSSEGLETLDSAQNTSTSSPDIPSMFLQKPASFVINRGISVKELWVDPNRLSEEMVCCMRSIFISLTESSKVNCKSSSSGSLDSSSSPFGPLSNLSLWSFSESPSITSRMRNPRFLPDKSKLLTRESFSDPYKVQGKLSWTDIGKYSLATEVSWMSAGKNQLEYASGALKRFRYLIAQLVKVNPIHLSMNARLAFWINVYNALMMHAYLAYGVPKSELKLFNLMQKVAYTVGGQSFNATSIEYGVLRLRPPADRPQTALLLALHKTRLSTEQKRFCLDEPEPIVVFALSCGMFSSPAVRVYTSGNIQEELREAQRDYIRASVGLSKKGKLLIPKMIQSFAKGLIDDANLVPWISQFLPTEQAAFVDQCMSDRRQSFRNSPAYENLPFDSRFRYLFFPETE